MVLCIPYDEFFAYKSKEVRESDLLPPVFPLVLYNGLVRWTAKQDIAELIKPVPHSLAKYRPNQCYFLLDEGKLPEDELLSGKDLTSKLIQMEKAQSPEALQAAIKELIVQLKGPGYVSLRRAFAVWIHRVLLRRMAPKETFPQVYDLEEIDTMLAERVIQWAEQWKNEGKKEGQLEGQTALLDRLLRKRFESAYDMKKQKLLQEASSDQLAIWADRILDATTIDDVFRDE